MTPRSTINTGRSTACLLRFCYNALLLPWLVVGVSSKYGIVELPETLLHKEEQLLVFCRNCFHLLILIVLYHMEHCFYLIIACMQHMWVGPDSFSARRTTRVVRSQKRLETSRIRIEVLKCWITCTSLLIPVLLYVVSRRNSVHPPKYKIAHRRASVAICLGALIPLQQYCNYIFHPRHQ